MKVCLATQLVVLAIVVCGSAQAEPGCFATGQQSDPALSCQVLADLGFLSGEFWVLAADGNTPLQTNCHMSGTRQNPIGVARFGRQVFADSTNLRITTSSTPQQLVDLVDYELVTDAEFDLMQQLGGSIKVETDFEIRITEDDSVNVDSFMEVRFQDSLSQQQLVHLAKWTLTTDVNGKQVQDNQNIRVVDGDRLTCSQSSTGASSGCGTSWSPGTPFPGQDSAALVVQRVHFRSNCCKDPAILFKDLGTVFNGTMVGAAPSCSPGCFAVTGSGPSSNIADAVPQWGGRNVYVFSGSAYWADVTVSDTAATSRCQTELRESGCAQLIAFRESGRFSSWFSARRITLDVLCNK